MACLVRSPSYLASVSLYKERKRSELERQVESTSWKALHQPNGFRWICQGGGPSVTERGKAMKEGWLGWQLLQGQAQPDSIPLPRA